MYGSPLGIAVPGGVLLSNLHFVSVVDRVCCDMPSDSGCMVYCVNSSVLDVSRTILILSFAICMILARRLVLIVIMICFAFLSHTWSIPARMYASVSSGCAYSPASFPNSSSAHCFATVLLFAVSWYAIAFSHVHCIVAASSSCGAVMSAPPSMIEL